MTFICEHCGESFEELATIKNGGGDIGEDWYVCPNCGSDDVSEGARCALCEENFASVHMSIRGDACVECMEKLVVKARELLRAGLCDDEYKILADYFDLDAKVI